MRIETTIPFLAAATLLVGQASAQGTLLDQPPVIPGPNYTFSGSGSFSQVLAEGFSVGAGGFDLDEVKTWGVYWTSNTPSNDAFVVNIYQDAGGLPSGVPLHSWSNPTLTRTAAGFTAGTATPYDVYEYEFDLGTTSLAAGDYWIEVYNTPANGDIWAIVNGQPDPNNGAPGFCFSSSLPAGTWNISQNTYDLAFVIEGGGGGFTLALNGPCPGQATLDFAGATPGGTMYLGWSAVTGAWNVPGGGCVGTTMGLVQPNLLLVLTADGGGALSQPVNVPAAVCGIVSIQALDLGTCTPSNVVGV